MSNASPRHPSERDAEHLLPPTGAAWELCVHLTPELKSRRRVPTVDIINDFRGVKIWEVAIMLAGPKENQQLGAQHSPGNHTGRGTAWVWGSEVSTGDYEVEWSADYEKCRVLGYKSPVRTSQETNYVSATETSRLVLFNIWGFHGGDYEEYRLLGCDAVWLL
jgi:hypothetical protein